DNTGFLSPLVVQALRTIGLSSEEPLTSVDWVNNRLMQERYSLYGGDRTWKKGLIYYEEGNKSEAYQTLGYSLHLLEDATVPEHTRDDPHAHALRGATGDYGSPYEEYTKKWTRSTIGELRIADGLRGGGIAPINRSSIEDYITENARYSNKYFFTKDTINDPKYEFPKIVRDDGNFGYGVDENGTGFPLVKIKKEISDQGSITIDYVIDVDSDYVLDAYFSRLARRAVIEGAGAIKLFKEQAERRARDYEVNKEFSAHIFAKDPEFASWFNVPTVSLLGELSKLYDFATSLLGDFGSLTLAIYDKFIATVGPGQTTVTPRSISAATSTPSQPSTATTTVPKPITASPTAITTIQNNPAPSSPTSSPAVENSQGLVAGTSTPSTATTTTNPPVVFGVSGTPTPTGGVAVSPGQPVPGQGGETPPNSSSTGELPPPVPTLPMIENFHAVF
ncbi:MAG: hypothetical protein Q8P16_01270, partial [bacterium]|nr:hypothetical protein [bacterium]